MAIILVLVTALVAPFFVDWTVYRSSFEAYAEAALGHKVTVLGEADMSILPSPTVTFTDVRVGGAEDPLLVISRFQIRMELPPLLKGEFRILDMTLDRPHLTISLDEDGRPDWLTAMQSGGALADIAADDVAFENISITDGAVTVVDARSGITHTLDNAELTVKARSLAGPFRIDGPVEIADERYSLSLATGRKQADGALRVKGTITPGQVSMSASIDGILSSLEGMPRFDGGFQLKGIEQGEDQPQVVWTANGTFEADTAHLTVDKGEYHFGPQERRSGFDGRLEMVYAGDRHFNLTARAKQIDLDRIYGGGPQDPVNLSEASAKVIDVLKGLPIPDMKGTISLDIPVVVAGGELLQEVKADLETRPGGWHISRLAGRIPGRTTIATEGDLVVRNKFSYRGSVSLNSEQPGALAAWLGENADGSTRIQPISLEGRVSLVDTGAALENLRVELDDAVITGGLSFRKPHQGRDEFGLSLVADRLNIDQVEDMLRLVGPSAGGATFWNNTNVSLMVRAREAIVRDVAGKDLALQASFSDDDLKIDRLYAGDLAGAEVDVSGRVENLFSAPVGSMTGSLKASDLDGLVSLLRSAWPDAGLLARLERASEYLVPAEFEGEFKGSGTAEGSSLQFDLSGTAGGVETTLRSSFEGRVDAWRNADLDMKLDLKSADGGQILRQIGLEILPVDELGAGDVTLEAIGRPDDGVELRMTAASPAASLSADGSLRWQKDKDANYSLQGTLAMDDLAPFALLAGRMMPVMAGDIPVDLRYALDGHGDTLAFRDISGRVGDVTLTANAEGSLAPSTGERLRRFKGRVDLSALDLMSLSEIVIGADQWASVGDGSSVWPSVAFDRPLLTSLDLNLDITAQSMPLGLGEAAGNVSANLRLKPDEMRLDDLTATYADGHLSGQLALRRSGAEGALSGRLKLEAADLSRLVWASEGRSVATGSLDLLADFEGVGRSLSGIVAGLTGGGTLKVSEGALRGLNPQAFSLVMRAVDAGLDLQDTKIRNVFLSHMQAGTLRFKTLEAALGILGGRVSARNIAVDAQAAKMFGSALINLNELSLDSDFSLTVDAGDEAVIGAEPQVGLLFNGPLDAPVRSVDVAPFTAYLTLRAFEREVERVEKLQSEILERQSLDRNLKRQSQERRRRAREAEEEAAREAEQEASQATAPSEESSGGNAVPEASETPAGPDGAQSGELTPSPISSEETAADFANRIRQVIGRQANDNQAQSGNEASGRTDDGALKPLDPPQTVEDLIAREIRRSTN
ncbi:AsmA-like C-terminal region-containing protein [Roseibium sp.]|uniref:AsmA family protein n=1 Tax=Roseibium sp. TaxID=1936156 RepID=UPI003A9715C9